jgi:hypothetical protein
MNLNGYPNGQSKATAEQIEYAVAPRELEDHSACHVDMPAVQEAAPAAFRVQQLRFLRRAPSDRAKGRGPCRIEFDHGAELIPRR